MTANSHAETAEGVVEVIIMRSNERAVKTVMGELISFVQPTRSSHTAIVKEGDHYDGKLTRGGARKGSKSDYHEIR